MLNHSKMQTRAFVLVLAAAACVAEIPKYMSLCHRNMQPLEPCLLKTLESLKPHLAQGIPMLAVPPIDPYRLKTLEVKRDRVLTDFTATFTNIEAVGGSDFVVNNLMVDLNRLEMQADVTVPRIKITLQYDVNGKITAIPLVGKGMYEGEAKNVHVLGFMKAKMYTKDNKQWLEPLTITTKITVGSVSDNRRGGHNIFSANNVRLMRDNQDLLAKTLAPVAEATLSEVLFKLASKIMTATSFSDALPD